VSLRRAAHGRDASRESTTDPRSQRDLAIVQAFGHERESSVDLVS
jgi:hypothetical protein